MKRLGSSVWLTAALLLPAEAVAQAGQCFDSELGGWTPIASASEVTPMPLPTEMGDSLSYSFPPRIRVEPEGTFSIPEGSLPTVHRTMEWSMSDGSMRFRLDWQNGYVGLVGSLSPNERGWSGHARTTSHRGGLQRYRQDLTLVRVSCESAPPVPASADTPLPLEIIFDDGRALALGPLPVESGLPEGESTITGTVGDGMFEGATGATVWIESGVVIRLRLDFPPGGAQQVLDRLSARFGVRDAFIWSWSNRTGRIQARSDSPNSVLLVIQPSGEPRNRL